MRKQSTPRSDTSRSGDLAIAQQTRTRRRSGSARQQLRRRRDDSLRAGLAVVAGRTAGALSRRLHLGGGTSIAGIVAQQMYPGIIAHLATQLAHGSVIVTGTNGKTTTSGFIASIMRNVGLTVWHNKEGSNLMRGVASSLVIRALPNGRLRRASSAISILEIDEATLPNIVQAVTPRVAVFTNLFRDQLDRYGEVESVAAYWRRAIDMLPDSSTLVLNADDPTTATIGENFSGKVLYYGVDDLSLNLPDQNAENKRHQVMDTRTCPRCGHDYIYDARFYSHMGHYHCPNCDLKRPQPDVRAIQVHTDSFDQQSVKISIGTGPSSVEHELTVPLPGLYNVYNALAAITAAHALDADWEPIKLGIQNSKPVFGRGESLEANGKFIRLLLAKNPTGFNEVMRTLFSDGDTKHVLFVLNDNIADGQDISWIWDVDFEQAVGKTRTLITAGTRALDLALRFKYAGVEQDKIMVVPPAPLKSENVETSMRGRVLNRSRRNREAAAAQTHETAGGQAHNYGLKQALNLALDQTPAGETLFVIPTYTALLEIHRDLEQRGVAPHYWEGKDS
jgi:lipid II isoglutaminyl synthase (glutamine-hydrolysing)